MTLTFLGTRGNIDISTRRHRRHASLMVAHRGARVMIDCGSDWLRTVQRLKPNAIVITHAHPDHVDGLRHGAPCPVYAPAAVWRVIGRWPIRDGHRLRPRTATLICGVTFEAWPLDHSVLAPAVGYRISAGGATVFYAPDVLGIRNRARALSGVTVYLGDGAAITRPIVRIEHLKGRAVGHAPIATQLDWCVEAGIEHAIFTHCGRGIVAGSSLATARVSELGRARHLETQVAYDGYVVAVRCSS